MFKQSVNLPTIFQVNEDIITSVPIFLKRCKIDFRQILVVSGEKQSHQYAEVICNLVPSMSYIVKNNDHNCVEEVKDYVLTNQVDLLIGVGGGTVLDVVKRVSYLTNTENLLVPTIISNDGLTSPISVITNEVGRSESLPGKMPFGIIVDLEIIRKAPVKYLQAAAGDILSNISSTNDWVIAAQQNKEEINDLAYMLSRSAAFALVHHESKDIRNRNFVKQIIQCQINSGLAMDLSGNSRPCSGSEHLISHAIDYLKLSDNTLHGLQVGSISIFCLYLQKRLDAKCINYALELDIPLAFHCLDLKIADSISEIFEKSFYMRPGRYTVLDTFRDKSFDEVYAEFLTFLERFRVFHNRHIAV